ncbi:MAG: shikimate dehydrogenase [Winogradskyella arenosi]
MENTQDNITAHKFGLLGRDISYSFSRGYFAEKFKTENLPHSYVNFDLPNIDAFKSVIANTPNIKGINVTIPYKEEVMPLLDELNETAKKIGAVNTIKITKANKLVGYNTDYYGFKNSLEPHLKPHHTQAIILGTGGASKAIAYALEQLNITYSYVSRTQKEGVRYTYEDLTEAILDQHKIIINCTPIGTFPKVEQCPKLPYEGLTAEHILYDLIYNPMQTKFLAFGKQKGATTINGSEMLRLQAEKSWEIWNME